MIAFVIASGCPGRKDATERTAGSTDRRARSNAVAIAASDADASADRTHAFSERRAERGALVELLEEAGISDGRVLSAMRRVPRHAFVDEVWPETAYQNRPLPIGYGQTISQPLVVATMTEAVHPKPTDKCLEIGTGSGYQAAILAELCAKVFSIEYLKPLAELAAANLRALGYGPDRVELRHGDGYRSWPEAAPFDVVVVTAAPDHVPRPLLDDLAVGGRLVIPVGARADRQQLELWTRIGAGSGDESFERRVMMGVRFVPLLGASAQRRAPPVDP